jgi:hypothetical protein
MRVSHPNVRGRRQLWTRVPTTRFVRMRIVCKLESGSGSCGVNPLGSRADGVSDLDGYRIEAIDIIMALGVFRGFILPEKKGCNVLDQAFHLSLKPIDCVAPGKKIQLILGAGWYLDTPRREQRLWKISV